MQVSTKFKVPNGKLLEVRADYQGSLNNVQILGDFFIHPEEAIGEIERFLIGTGPDKSEQEISKRLSIFVASNKIELVGVTADSIARALVILMSK